VSHEESIAILEQCHSGPYGGHMSSQKTARQVLQCGFFWPTIFKDSYDYVLSCDQCQMTGNISKRDQMPFTSWQELEIFDVWGIDYMGPFPSSYGFTYILVTLDYVSKWVEAITTKTCDSKPVKKLFKDVIFPRFGVPHTVIFDGGSHFFGETF